MAFLFGPLLPSLSGSTESVEEFKTADEMYDETVSLPRAWDIYLWLDETRKRTPKVNELGIDTTSFGIYHGTMKDGKGDVTTEPAGTTKQGGKILWGSLPDPDDDAPRAKAISKVEHHFTEDAARSYAKYTAHDLLTFTLATGWKGKDRFKKDTLIKFLQNHDMKHCIPIAVYGGNIPKRKRRTKNGYHGSGFVDIMPDSESGVAHGLQPSRPLVRSLHQYNILSAS